MPKGDDHLQKKRTKAVRKRMRRAGGDSLEAIQGVQAAKRRRKSGTRRSCEGMCYTLPTPDDPFNERSDKRRRRQENRKLRSKEVPEGEILEFETFSNTENGAGIDADAGYEKQQLNKKRKVSEDSEGEFEALQDKQKFRKVNQGNASEETRVGKHSQNGNDKRKSLKLQDSGVSSLGKEREDINGGVINELVLAVISETGLLPEDSFNVDIMNGGSEKGGKKDGSVFGRQCRAAISKGGDVVAVSSRSWEDRVLGYVVPAAIHIKAQLSKDAALQGPLVLITVASQEQAMQVRSVFKPLKKTLGISSVCVHTGTGLDSQIRGFTLLTPEIVVATPDRLLELLAVKAISLSRVSFQVIDGLDEIVNKGFETHLSKSKDYLPKGSQKLVICGKFSKDIVNVARQFVKDPIERVVPEPNLENNGVFVAQEVTVLTSPEKRLPKLLKILEKLKDKQERNTTYTILVNVENVDALERLLPAIQGVGHHTGALTGRERSQVELLLNKLRNGRVKTIVTTENLLGLIPLESFQVVINYSFPSTMQVYKQILTGMARRSVHGELHSFCTATMAPMARELVEVLQKCRQEVPQALQMLADAAALVQSGKQ